MGLGPLRVLTAEPVGDGESDGGLAAFGQFGSVGQQTIGQGMNRPPTMEIRPGYQFNVMVTEDLVFPAAYKG